ncbi:MULTISPECIES: hypothetical protein [Rhizobium]|nr:hypothetical protein [Rhizobium lusitanum]
MNSFLFANTTRRLTRLLIETSVLIAGAAAILSFGLPSVHLWS